MSDYGVITEKGTVRFERLLPGPIDRVWSYLTDSQKRGTWLAAGEMELEVGGKVVHVFRNSDLTENDDPAPEKYAKYENARMEGEVTACEPPRLLSYTWPEESGEPSEVTFELEESQGDKVRLVLTHRRLATRGGVVGVSGGWHAHLAVLAARLEGREPEGFWRTHTRLEAEYEERIPASA